MDDDYIISFPKINNEFSDLRALISNLDIIVFEKYKK